MSEASARPSARTGRFPRSGTTHPARRIPRPSPAARTGLFLFLGVAAVNLAGSWIPSYWYDESASLQLARLPWGELVGFVAQRDAVHALYAAFLHVWIGLFGEAEAVTRLPSVLATAAAAVGVAALGRRLGLRKRGAVAAAVVFAILPRTVLQAIEARSYAIATALLVAAALLALRAARRRTARAWLAYVAVATLATWTFAYALLALPGLALLARRRGEGIRATLRRALVVVGAPAALALPLVALMVAQRGQVAWLDGERITPESVLVEPLFGSAPWLALAVAALLAAGIARRAFPPTPVTAGLVVWLVLPGAVLVGASVVALPLFTPRYLVVCAPALALLVGLALDAWDRGAVVTVVVVAALLSAPAFAASRATDAKRGHVDLRAIATAVSSHAEPGDAFLLAPGEAGTYRPRTAYAAYPDAFAGLRDIGLVRPFWQTGTFADDTAVPSSAALATVDRVWVATRGTDPFAGALRAAGLRRSSTERITGTDVSLWER